MGPMGPQGPAGTAGQTGPAGNDGSDATALFIAGSGVVNEGLMIPNGTTISVNVGEGPGQIPKLGLDGKLPSSVMPPGGGGGGTSLKVAFIKDVRPSGQHGGDCIAGDWRVRELNTISGDSGFATLSGNSITLSAGKYMVEATAPAYLSNMHQAKLVNLTAGGDAIVGSSERNHATNSSTTSSSIQGMVNLSAATTYQIQHRCFISKEIFGFGVAGGFGTPEVYTQVKITKLD